MARAIDGFSTTSRVRHDSLSGAAPAANTDSAAAVSTAPVRRFTPTDPIPPKPAWRERLQTPVLILSCMLAGFLFQNLWFGVGAIGVYAVASFVFRIGSRATFTLAFISLVSVIPLLLIKQNIALASNFATYTFLLLVIGVIALSFEAKPQARKKRRNGR